MTACSGCEHLMLGKWAPWCHKAGTPLLAVVSCPCGRSPVYFEPLDVRELVQSAKQGGRRWRAGRR